MDNRPDLSKRRFLAGAVAALVTLPAFPVWGKAPRPRELAFRHLHTGETLRVEYHDGRRYLDDALRTVDHYLRDFRTGEVHPIDPSLLDLLYTLRCRTVGRCRPFEVFSAYRSPKTNAMLRRHSSGVAKHSFHMRGQAIDVRLPGVDVRHLYRTAWNLQRGGVGLYTRSGFIHVDTGPVRTWGG